MTDFAAEHAHAGAIIANWARANGVECKVLDCGDGLELQCRVTIGVDRYGRMCHLRFEPDWETRLQTMLQDLLIGLRKLREREDVK